MSEIEIREKKWVIKQVKGMTETRVKLGLIADKCLVQDEFWQVLL